MESSEKISIAELRSQMEPFFGRTIFDEDMYLMICLIFLKGFYELELSQRQGKLPPEAEWPVLLIDPSYDSLMQGFRAFELLPENKGFANPFSQFVFDRDKWNENPKIKEGWPAIKNTLASFELWLALMQVPRTPAGTTPTSISSLLAKILSPRAKSTIYDPTSGTAQLLSIVANSKMTGDTDSDVKIFGQEANQMIACIGKMHVALYGLPPQNIAVGDTLLSPQHLEDGQIRKFDYVVANAPFNMSRSKAYVDKLRSDPFGRFAFGLPSNSLDFAFIQHVVASLNENGRGAIVTTPGVLFRGGVEGRIRQTLVQQDIIEAVISLPAGMFTNTKTPVVLLLFNKQKPEFLREHIRFIYADELGERTEQWYPVRLSESEQSRIVDAIKSPSNIKNFAETVPIERIEKQEFRLTPAIYMDLLDFDKFLGGEYGLVNLADKAEIIQGTRIVRGGKTPFIQGRNLAGRLSLSELELATLPESVKGVYTKQGDILVQRIGDQPK